MTAKEQLIELVEGLSDAEAEAWLVEMRARYAATEKPARGSAGAKSHLEVIDEIIASMPPEAFEDAAWPEKPDWLVAIEAIREELGAEAFEGWPSSDQVDEVVYRLHL